MLKIPPWRPLVGAASIACLAALCSGCATQPKASSAAAPTASEPSRPHPPAAPLQAGMDPAANPNPFPSTYVPGPSVTTAIVHAEVLTGTGTELHDATVLMRDGKIVAVGTAVDVPAEAVRIDASGKWVTPGLIDVHSHLGVYATPAVPALSDGNEATAPNTAEVWAEHSVWPQDPGFERALAGGVTSLEILPGSANLFGGRSVTLKNVPAVTTQGMKFPGAPYGLKMACGENPKRVYGSRSRAPSTRMGNVALYRSAWVAAADYARKWDDYRAKSRRGEKADPPKRDLQLDTLVGVLRGEILVQNHCYRADEMAQMIDISKEFGFHISAFHHASEAYKIAPLLAREHICLATWAEWSGFKMESLDGIEANAALSHRAGACTVIHSDDPIITQHLNQEAGLAMAAGNRAGLRITRAEAISWITLNAARAIGVDTQTGSLEPGKMADVVVWSTDPFSVYALAERVYIDGHLTFDRAHRAEPRSDFELGRSLDGGFR